MIYAVKKIYPFFFPREFFSSFYHITRVETTVLLSANTKRRDSEENSYFVFPVGKVFRKCTLQLVFTSFTYVYMYIRERESLSKLDLVNKQVT